MSALFAAGAAGSPEDSGKKNYAGAECWELLNMRNVSAYTSNRLRSDRWLTLRIVPLILAVSIPVWRLAQCTSRYPDQDRDSGGTFNLRGCVDKGLALVPYLYV